MLCGVSFLPGNIDSYILMRGPGENAKQLVEDGGQKVDHHMTFHCMKTLVEMKKLFNIDRHQSEITPINLKFVLDDM